MCKVWTHQIEYIFLLSQRHFDKSLELILAFKTKSVNAVEYKYISHTKYFLISCFCLKQIGNTVNKCSFYLGTLRKTSWVKLPHEAG